MILVLALLACSGDGEDQSTDSPVDTGTTPIGTDSRTDTATTPTGDTAPTCAPSVELGTGELAFEALTDRIDMINGPQGGWHVVTAARLCDLGSDAVLSFSATRVTDELEVGGGERRAQLPPHGVVLLLEHDGLGEVEAARPLGLTGRVGECDAARQAERDS